MLEINNISVLHVSSLYTEYCFINVTENAQYLQLKMYQFLFIYQAICDSKLKCLNVMRRNVPSNSLNISVAYKHTKHIRSLTGVQFSSVSRAINCHFPKYLRESERNFKTRTFMCEYRTEFRPIIFKH